MGRAILLTVVGVAAVFSYLQISFHEKEFQVAKQVADYAGEIQARNFANSATDLVIRRIVDDYDWDDGWADKPLLGSTVDVTVMDQNDDGALKPNQRRVMAAARYNGHTVTTVALVNLPTSLPKVPGAFGIYTDNIHANYSGNAFEVDGNDTKPPSKGGWPGYPGPESALPGMTVGGNQAYGQATTWENQNQQDNVKGASGDHPGYPSVATNADLTYNALGKYIDAYIHNADQTFTGNYNISGGTLGTPESPQVTVLDGDGQVTGNTQGAGILVITTGHNVGFQGTFTFEGLVINQGTTNWQDAGNVAIFGSYLMAHPDSGQTLSYDLRGNVGLYYSSEALHYAGQTMEPVGSVRVQYYE